ncbi:MAG TPA: ROK family protein, partial [Gaiellaceae bacterium]|nr:ROK family protein [Gaiellaceae bacterium]
MDLQHVIGVDLGGTKILAGVVDRNGTVLRRHEVPTPTASAIASRSASCDPVGALVDDQVAALGFGVPSVVDPASGVSLGSINIPLAGVSVAAVLGEVTVSAG